MARTYSWNAWEASLTSPVTDASTTIVLDTTLGLRAPGYLVIEAESPTKREYVWFASLNGSALEGVSRGLGGSIAGAADHDAGVKMRAVAMHQMFDDLWDSIGSGGGDLQAHIDDPNDPHAPAGYLKQDVADGRYLSITDAASTYLSLDGSTPMTGAFHLDRPSSVMLDMKNLGVPVTDPDSRVRLTVTSTGLHIQLGSTNETTVPIEDAVLIRAGHLEVLNVTAGPSLTLENSAGGGASHDFRFNMLSGVLRVQSAPFGTQAWTTLDSWDGA